MWWQEAVTYLKGIGPKKAAELAAVGVNTVGDLLEYYPRQDVYLDYGNLKKIRELLPDGSRQMFTAEVMSARNGIGAHGRRYALVTVRDETGYAALYFFQHQSYGVQKMRPGMKFLIMGRVRPGRNAAAVSEIIMRPWEDGEEIKPEILPLYALSGSLTQNLLRKWMRQALALAETEGLPESLPRGIVEKCRLQDRLAALKNIHFPASWEALRQAQRRFIFEELFLLECGLLCYRRQNHDAREGIRHEKAGAKLDAVLKNLPFALTSQQEAAWQEISADMEKAQPMHRILQGDVGSGKTVLSALALAKAAENGYQGCLMAPTEILAQQHFATLQEFLQPAGIKIALLVGGMRAKARRELLLDLELGLVDVVVGTHALLVEDVRFAKLSLAITDEQHRFGVEQRARLANKAAAAPDVLVMTATPIPRTLALTVYGDLDISVMRGRPPGRKPVTTLCYNDEKRLEVYRGMRRQVAKGCQAYIVCPLIEDSEQLSVRSAEKVFQELASDAHGILYGIPCALLHGRLKPAEKDAIMAAFAAGKIKVLVSTTVIEVGVNVPNATLIVIENAERFGLAQLHQLRGRVGRGEQESFCVLLAGADNPEALARLEVLRTSEDGFYLAEKDLEQRGVGELFGLRQHGLPDLRIANIIRDTEVIAQVRKLAEEELLRPDAMDEIKNLVQMQFGKRFAMIFNT